MTLLLSAAVFAGGLVSLVLGIWVAGRQSERIESFLAKRCGIYYFPPKPIGGFGGVVAMIGLILASIAGGSESWTQVLVGFSMAAVGGGLIALGFNKTILE